MFVIYLILVLIAFKIFAPKKIKIAIRNKINQITNTKGFMFYWILSCVFFVFISSVLIPILTKVTPEELENTRIKRLHQEFRGIVIDKPCCDHWSNLRIHNYDSTFIDIAMSRQLDSLTSFGDSIKKLKMSTDILVKSQQDTFWILSDYCKK